MQNNENNSQVRSGTSRKFKIVDYQKADAESTGLSEYEQQRLRTIEQNRLVLKTLGVGAEKAALSESLLADSSTVSRPYIERKGCERKRRVAAPERQLPARRTRSSASKPEQDEGDTLEQLEEIGEDKSISAKLIPMEEYFKDKGDSIRTDGHFKGWVSQELREKYGLEANAREAWEKNGGGKYSHKNILGNMTTPVGQKPAGWSKIKHQSSLLLKKNPNAYFYRHTEPGLYQGDWTEEEHTAFLETARTYGCGDKWGLFSTYIPHRVGYQCSNYYRSVILPQGLVFDSSYRMSADGTAVFVGESGRATDENVNEIQLECRSQTHFGIIDDF